MNYIIVGQIQTPEEAEEIQSIMKTFVIGRRAGHLAK